MKIITAEKQYAASLAETMMSAENSGFMLFSPGERKLDEQGSELFIEHIGKQQGSELLIAVEDDRVVGYVMVRSDSTERTKHRASIAIGVHEDYRGQGIGTYLLDYVFEWALMNGIGRLELTVLAKNTNAILLYEKMGYQREGIKRNSLKINDEYEDEIYMSQIIE